MSEPLDIVIVGGGTAGWMTAAALVGVISPGACRVRLVESEEIGTVGVGEATLPQIKDFNDWIGILEPEFMRKTNASFKLGIEFRDWGSPGARYIHPFGVHGQPIGGIAFNQCWTRAMLAGQAADIGDYSYAIVAARRNRFDFPVDDPSAINSTYSYAYHFDAGLYARYLRGFSEARGVRRTEGKVADVTLKSDSGDIASIKLASGEVIEGDLFIDCSGFRALLIGKALGHGYEDWSKWLPCDSALAVPCERSDDFSPYTRSTRREAGWQWRIALQHRTGNGYVFSSAFIEQDAAAAKLMANLDAPALGEPRLLRFKAGRRDTSWSHNCIAIGLSSGFLEPLESTSIYLMQVGIINLVKLFPRRTIDPVLRTEFNRLVDNEYARVRDFLILHYWSNPGAEGDLWEYCRHMDVPDTLLEKRELFRRHSYIHKYKDGLFAPPSWLSAWVGQGVSPEGYDRLADNLPFEVMAREMEAQRQRISDRVDAMPTHADFVRDYCAGEQPVRAAQAVDA